VPSKHQGKRREGGAYTLLSRTVVVSFGVELKIEPTHSPERVLVVASTLVNTVKDPISDGIVPAINGPTPKKKKNEW
jgi:hypothetical protein